MGVLARFWMGLKWSWNLKAWKEHVRRAELSSGTSPWKVWATESHQRPHCWSYYFSGVFIVYNSFLLIKDKSLWPVEKSQALLEVILFYSFCEAIIVSNAPQTHKVSPIWNSRPYCYSCLVVTLQQNAAIWLKI